MNTTEKQYREYFLTKIEIFIKELGDYYSCTELSSFMNEYKPNSKLFNFFETLFSYEDKNGEEYTVWYQDLDMGNLEVLYNILESEYDNHLKQKKN
jgi:hypothetical protein